MLPKDGLMYIPHRVILKDNPKKEDDVKVFHAELPEIARQINHHPVRALP